MITELNKRPGPDWAGRANENKFQKRYVDVNVREISVMNLKYKVSFPSQFLFSEYE